MSREELAALLHRAGRLSAHGHGHNPMHGQGRILHTLAAEGSLSQRQLQEQFGMRSASVSELLLKLERKGLIERTRSEEDRRSFVVSLTPAGAAAAQSGEPAVDPFAALSAEEQEELQRLLEKLLRSAAEAPAGGRGGMGGGKGHGGRGGCGRGSGRGMGHGMGPGSGHGPGHGRGGRG